MSASNKHGWYDFVPNLDRPCLLVLPDGGTTNDRAGSGMLKEFESKVYGVQTVVFDKNAAETFLAKFGFEDTLSFKVLRGMTVRTYSSFAEAYYLAVDYKKNGQGAAQVVSIEKDKHIVVFLKKRSLILLKHLKRKKFFNGTSYA